MNEIGQNATSPPAPPHSPFSCTLDSGGLQPEAVLAEILRLPLPRIPQPDTLIWRFDKHGKYSAKSGYQIAVKEKFKEVPSCSDSSKSRWDVVWSNELPEKVKIFMWRAVKNLLPTASNLWKRKIVVEPVCARCGCRREDVVHALLECKAARRVWKKTEFYEDIKMMAQQDILSMIQEVAVKRSKEGREMVAAICWAIWHSRNLQIFEGKQENPLSPVARAEAIVESYKRIKCSNDQVALKAPRKKIQAWMAPPEGWYKVNVDAAINSSAQQAGMGVVIRNSGGKIIAAAVKRVPYRGSVVDMEAEAVLFGIQNAFQVNCRPMIIESDSSEAVELSINRKGSLAEIAWTIADIQLFLKHQNPSRIQFVPRVCNTLADSLAKLALSFERPALWLENFPENVLMLFSKSV